MPVISLTELPSMLRNLYRLQDTLPKLIEDASIPEQKMDDYYVKLQIVLDDKKAGIEKPSIEMGDMFDSFQDQGAAGKILIIGSAGVGKTTFLNHITYEWGQGNIFTDKFDYIFKIRLKNLLNQNLCNELIGAAEPLMLLIQRSLEQQQIEQRVKYNNLIKNGADIHKDVRQAIFENIPLELIKTLDKTRTVLLLDGYDEIEHLNRGGHIAREIISNILEYPNVVLTSRPNAVSSNLESRFERKIENIGIGQGAQQYIEKYFNMQSLDLVNEVEKFSLAHSDKPIKLTKLKLFRYYEQVGDSRSREIVSYFELVDKGNKKDELDETLDQFKASIIEYHHRLADSLLRLYHNAPNLREVLVTPINAAMVCLISSDSYIMARFEQDFNIGELYNGVIVWLGKRYLHKFQSHKDFSVAIDIDRALNIDDLSQLRKEFSTLKSLAYSKFKDNQVLILGAEVDGVARGIDPDEGSIRKINKIGLLKAENYVLLYELEPLFYGVPDADEVKPNKIYLYINKESDQLCYTLQGRNGVENYVISEVDGLSGSLQSIKTLLNKRERHLSSKDERALAEHIANKGYTVHQANRHSLNAEELEANDLINRKHAFIHLSFQEYLTAYNLKELLLSEDQTIYIQAAQFIGEHRNEPRYLLTLKFLAGIVTHDQSKNRDFLVQRFWEAVSCNIDGVIELGMSTKVTLLMHLLAQAKINNELDSRIPNVDKLQDLVDVIVTSDISSFHEQIIASGYIPPKITESILAILDLNYQWRLENAHQIIERQDNFAEIAAVNLKTLDNEALTLTEEELVIHKEKVIILRKTELKIAIKIALKLVANGTLSSQDLMNKILTIMSSPDWQIKLVAISAIEELIKNKFNLIDLDIEFINKIITKIQWHVTDDNLNKEVLSLFSTFKTVISESDVADLEMLIKQTIVNQYAIFTKAKDITEFEDILPSFPLIGIDQEIVTEVIQQLQNANWLQRYNSIMLLKKIVEHEPELIDDKIYEILIQKLNDDDFNVRSAIAVTIGLIAEKKPDLIDFSILIVKLGDENWSVRKVAIKVIHAIAIRNFELIDIDGLLEKLSDVDTDIRDVVASAISSIAINKPDSIDIEDLIEKLNDDDFYVRSGATKAIAAIIDKTPDLITDIMMDNLVKQLCYSNNDSDSDSDSDALAEQSSDINKDSDSDSDCSRANLDIMAQKTGTITDKKPDLIAVIQAIDAIADKKPDLITDAILNNLMDKLSDDNPQVISTVASVIATIVKNNPSLIDSTIAYNLIEKLNDYDFNVRSAVALAIGSIAEKRSELINIDNLLEQLDDYDSDIRYTVSSAFGAIAKKNPELINDDIINKLIEKLNDTAGLYSTAVEVVKIIGTISDKKPELITAMIADQLIEKLNDVDSNIRAAVASVIGTIAIKIPDLVTSITVDSLIEKVNDKFFDVKSSVASAISAIAAVKPELINIGSLIEKLTNGDTNAGPSAVASAIGAMADIKPELINIGNLIEKLTDENWSVCQAAIKAIGIIAESKPELINSDITNRLTEKLNDAGDYGRIASAATEAMIVIINKRPDLVTSIISDQQIKKLNNVDPEIRLNAVRILKDIIINKPELINVNDLIELLRSSSRSDSYVGLVVIDILAVTAESQPESINIDSLIELLSDSDSAIGLAAGNAFKIIADKQSELITATIVNNLIEKFSEDVGPAVAIVIGIIATSKTELLSIDSLVEKLKDDNCKIRHAAISAILTITEINHDLITNTIVNILLESLNDDSDYDKVASAAAKALSVIADKKPDLINISDLVEKLSDETSQIKPIAAKILRSLALRRLGLIEMDNLIKLLSNNDILIRSAAAEVLKATAENNPELINVDSLLEKLRDGDSNIKSAVISTIGVLADKHSDLITTTIAESIVENLTDFSAYDKIAVAAAKTMSIIAGKKPELINLDFLIENLHDRNHEIKSLFIKTIVAIIEQNPLSINYIVANSIIAELTNFNPQVRLAVISGLKDILKKGSELINISDLVEKIGDGDHEVRSKLIKTIIIIFESKPELISSVIVDELIKKLSDPSARAGAASILKCIVSNRSDLISTEIINSLISNLNDDDNSFRLEVNKTLFTMIIPLSKVVIKLLDHPSQEAREFVIQVFIAILSDAESCTRIKIDQLLAIISFYDPKDKEKKTLLEIAKKVLYEKLPVLQESDIEYITENYENFFKLSSESPIFLRKLYTQILSDSHVTLIEKAFIIKSIQNGMSSSFSSDGKIMFDGITYVLDIESRTYFNEIIAVALQQKEDILVKQYTEYQPIFINHEVGMQLAAIDINEVVSIINGAKLDSHCWHLSLMHASDHKRSEPTSTFLLIERRDEFGYYEARQFSSDDTMVMSNSRSFTRYPTMTNMDNLKFRTAIFGEMRYDLAIGYKPRYYAITIELELDKGLELIASIAQAIGIITLRNAVTKIVPTIEPFVFASWSEYVDHAQEYKKAQLFALSEQSNNHEIQTAAKFARSDSFQIQATESLANLDQLKQKLRNINFDDLETILNREQYGQQQQKILNDLDTYQINFYQTLVVQLNAMYVATSSINSQLIDSNGSNQATTGKIGSFLQSISSHVPLVGVGVQMIGAIMVQVDQNDQANSVAKYATIMSNSGDMGKLAGEIALKLAPHAKTLVIPEEGFSGRLGQAMDMLSNAVASSETATQVVSALRTLNPANVIDSFDFVSLAANCISGLKARIHDVNEATKQDTSAVSSKTTDKVKKYAERLFFGVEQSIEDTEIAEGQAKANDIAAFIIKQIFTGVVTAGDSRIVSAQIQNIVEIISKQFHISELVKELQSTIASPIVKIEKAIEFVPEIARSQPIAEAKNEVKSLIKIYPDVCDEEKIAQKILERYKLLLDADKLIISNSQREQSFISSLAHALKQQTELLDLSEEALVNAIAIQLQHSDMMSISDDKLVLGNKFAAETSFFRNIIDTAKQELSPHKEVIVKSSSCCIVSYITEVNYDNLLLSHEELFYQAYKRGDIAIINSLIELGKDEQVAREVIETTQEYGAKHVLDILFAVQSTKSIKLLEIENEITISRSISQEQSSEIDNNLDRGESRPLSLMDAKKETALERAFIIEQIYQISNIANDLINRFLYRLDLNINWQYKKFVYHQDLNKFSQILQNHNIDRSIDVLRDYSDFRKSVLLSLHPDKGGNNEDFIYVRGLQEKISADIDINQLLADQFQTIQYIVYKAGIGFKILDTIVDATRLIHEPTIDHTKKIALDSTYIYSMYSGVNGYSLGISTADILYKTYQGEYINAISQTATTISYMALPTMIGYMGIPYLGIIYSASITIYSGYNAIINGYSFYLEYISKTSELKSSNAYKNFFETLSNSPLQLIYDFSAVSKEYEIKINKINLNIEKSQIKQQLEAKGEFGNKLYDYIYTSMLEEKYTLLNKIANEELTKEQAEVLKAKHIAITITEQSYEHCIEIIKLKEDKVEHYYCYNEEQQVIDHIVIGESRGYIEVIERL